MAPSGPPRTTAAESAAKALSYGAGITALLIVYGLLQERIMFLPYGDPPAFFSDSVALVFCNRIVAMVFAVCMAIVRGEPAANKAPLWKYLVISALSVYASTCQYDALRYVIFPVQMLGKSSKMLPVMLWRKAASGRNYSAADWLVACAVTCGVVEFLVAGPISSHGDSSTSATGLLLLLGFLLLDGFTSVFQESLFKGNTATKYNHLVYMNISSCIVSLGTLILSGRLPAAAAFARGHPIFVRDALSMSAAGLGCQVLIYSQVKDFGTLVFTATMNLRQAVSIFISYVVFGHPIVHLQIVGLCLVFCGLLHKSYLDLVTRPAAKRERQRLLSDGKAESA